MKLAIMQPYLLPYVGYFQLIASADLFIIYDNIEYTKKGWINRNRRLQGRADRLFSLPLKKAPDSANVDEREMAADFDPGALLNQLKGSYSRAPYFSSVWPVIERIVAYEERNLFRYIHHSVQTLCAHLGVTTTIRISSAIDIDHKLKGQEKVIALCDALQADVYINTIGGVDLYDRAAFRRHGIELRFLKPRPFEYAQFGAPFVPWLSIVDVMMFNSPDAVQALISSHYEFV